LVVDFSKINLSLQEPQTLILEMLDSTKVCSLGGCIINGSTILNYNELSTLTFEYPYTDITSDNYALITEMKVVNWYPICKFLISKVEESNDGIKRYKTVTCNSLEIEFKSKQFYLDSSTFCLYSPVISSGTIISYILEAMPNWTLGSVSSSLIGVYRYFSDSVQTNLYDFIKNTLQQKFSMIVDFDTNNRIINLRSIDDVSSVAPVFISLDNLISKVDITNDSSTIFTSVSVYGANDLTIASCNPLGNSKLIDLSHYLSTDYMSQEMITAYNNFKSNYNTNKTSYSLLNTQYYLLTSKLTNAQADLVTLNTTLSTYTTLQSTYISAIAAGDTSFQSKLDAVNAEIVTQNSLILTQQTLINSIQAEINSISASITSIVSNTQLSNFFTESQLKVLESFIVEENISDSSFVANTTTTYINNSSNNTITSLAFSLSSATSVTKITSVANKELYSITSGILTTSDSTIALNTNIIKMEIERKTTDNSFILSAYLSTGSLKGTNFDTGCISITGYCNVISSSDTTMNFTISSGSLYFSSSSNYSVYAVAQQLMDYGETCLSALCQPAYSFSIDSVNFINLFEFSSFKDNLILGKQVYLKLNDEDNILNPFLLSVQIDMEDISKMTLKFSDTYCQKGKFSLVNLLEESVSAGASLNLNSYSYSNWVSSGASTSINEYMTNNFDLAKQAITSASGLCPTLDNSGLRMKKLFAGGSFSPKQAALIENEFCFTKDNWATVSAIFGEMTYNGNSLYGVDVDALIGRFVATNNLTVECGKTSATTGSPVFKMDSGGCTLVDSVMDVYANNSQISINPYKGIVMGLNPLYTDASYTLNDNNVKFKIDIATGNVLSKGDFYANNFYFNDGGNIKTLLSTTQNQIAGSILNLKGVNVLNGSTTTFSVDTFGNVNFSGTLTGSTINSSTINSTTINGGTITSATTINVGTDISVGNNIYIGDVSDRLTTKMIKFTGTSTISCKNDVLELSAEHVGFLGSTVDFSGASGIVWGSNTPAAVFG